MRSGAGRRLWFSGHFPILFQFFRPYPANWRLLLFPCRLEAISGRQWRRPTGFDVSTDQPAVRQNPAPGGVPSPLAPPSRSPPRIQLPLPESSTPSPHGQERGPAATTVQAPRPPPPSRAPRTRRVRCRPAPPADLPHQRVRAGAGRSERRGIAVRSAVPGRAIRSKATDR